MSTAEPQRMRLCYTDGCHVFEDYTIKDDKLCRIGPRVRIYDATQCTDLPAVLANVQAGNAEALLQFARTYGLLGYVSLNFEACLGHFDEEPLAWIWAQIQTVQLCLKLKQYCDEQRAAWVLEDMLDQYRTQPSPQDPTTDAIRIAVMGHTEVLQLTSKQQDSVYEVAQTIRHAIIRRNTKDLIYRSRGAYGNTRSVLDYGSLIEVVYWHLSKMDHKLVRQCEQCSAWFTTQHARQRFCPPRESQRESSCAVNHRQWKYREEQRKKKQVSTP